MKETKFNNVVKLIPKWKNKIAIPSKKKSFESGLSIEQIQLTTI